jgi:hypothetical protein
MAVMGCVSAQRANGVSSCTASSAVRCSTGSGRASTTRGADQQHHQRRSRPDLGRPPRSSSSPRSTWAPRESRDDAWDAHRRHPGDEIWASQAGMREQLVIEARRRMRASWLKRGASQAELGWIEDILDPTCSPSASPAGSRPTSGSPSCCATRPAEEDPAEPHASRSSWSSPARATRPTRPARSSSSRW